MRMLEQEQSSQKMMISPSELFVELQDVKEEYLSLLEESLRLPLVGTATIISSINYFEEIFNGTSKVTAGSGIYGVIPEMEANLKRANFYVGPLDSGDDYI